MKSLFLISFVWCKTSLIQGIIHHMNNIIIENTLVALTILVFSLFILTRGLRFKFVSVSALLALLISFSHTAILAHIQNSTIRSYILFALNHKVLFVLCSFAGAYLLLGVFDFLIYLLFLYLIFWLHDSINAGDFSIYLSVFFIFAGFAVHFLVKSVKNVVLASFFSIIGSFMLLFSFEYFMKKKYGFLDIYINYLNGIWNTKTFKCLIIQGSICIMSSIFQIITKTK
ncbi:hypothetical protein NCER_102264 [Vairimorpha ceranae BRL01]|uniref:Uncharacterized protein n=2 Tax=Vairimorpha ceranae TaxID=40302 RepID=C4VBQ8_VAIC1|nr:hypothetical protein AAJ76_2200019323 [Vairimorpha ceranae]EEQ81344.1 hypothetical protein NCER_102264 [Vairimorpha ceranae BRL01]KAF5140598.1 hypothetical protein G9O61_00g014030 [Vairimorpha ceranae]KKO75399.1 hypothetical protein AAJ76_2200019323 [Vairimorpha ceranae]